MTETVATITPETSAALSPAERQFNEDVVHAAGYAHEKWREGWRQDHTLPDDTVEPRLRPTTDEDWKAANGGATEVNMDTSFSELPKDKQEIVLASAAIATEDVYRDAFYGQYAQIYADEGAAALRAHATGHKVHNAWLSTATTAATEQQQTFDELSPAEQQKDIDFHDGAVEAVLSRIENGEFEVTDRLLLKWLQEDAIALAARADIGAVVGDIHPVREGWVYVKLDIPGQKESFDGEYPLGTVATYVWEELNLSGEGIVPGAERVAHEATAHAVGKTATHS
jgi:hypothetical protein